jgi:hypothetical protein
MALATDVFIVMSTAGRPAGSTYGEIAQGLSTPRRLSHRGLSGASTTDRTKTRTMQEHLHVQALSSTGGGRHPSPRGGETGRPRGRSTYLTERGGCMAAPRLAHLHGRQTCHGDGRSAVVVVPETVLRAGGCTG